MPKVSIPVIIGFFLFFFSNHSLGQPGAPFAQMVDISHACAGGLGSVEFEIIGNPNDYVYYWAHGPTELKLENLPPGIYTLVVENMYGCRQEYPVEILLIERCVLTYEVLATDDICWVLIVLHVANQDGQEIQEQALDIAWDDFAPFGLQRKVPVPGGFQSSQYCVQVEISGKYGKCCEQDACIIIQGNPRCNRTPKAKVIVNEFNRSIGGRGQFAELLVLGSGNCEDTFDLRGYIVDDNNGDLIPGNEFVLDFSAYLIGVDEGYLFFSYNPTWSAVPNGSLIVVYDEQGEKHPSIPPDDPDDSDQDGVYVLAANAPGYFMAKTGYWNDFEIQLDYSGTLEPPSWELVALTPDADGIQVRHPDGSFCHGVSLGASPFADSVDFPLYLTSISISNQNCMLTGPDYMLKEDFECLSAADSLQSPGQPNSLVNAGFIYSLRDCRERSAETTKQEGGAGQNSIRTRESDLITVYPNPTKGTINCDYYSAIQGTAVLRLLSTSGQKIIEQDIIAVKGEGSWIWYPFQDTPSGLFLMEVVFPSGEKTIARIALIK